MQKRFGSKFSSVYTWFPQKSLANLQSNCISFRMECKKKLDMKNIIFIVLFLEMDGAQICFEWQ